MFENAAADIKEYYNEYKHSGVIKRIFYLIFRHDLLAVLIFRFGKWATYDCKTPVLKFLSKILYFFLRRFSVIIFHIAISPLSEIGPGLNVHYGPAYLKAQIGRNCVISQFNVIGHVGGFKGRGVPTLGDNVYVGAGAKILGEIKIGNNVKIGANAVVIEDIPNNAVVVGIPAKVVKINK